MYHLLKTSFFAVLALLLFGFQSSDSNWKDYFQNDEIRIEVKTEACNNVKDGINNSYVLLRVSNKTNNKIQVSFFKESWYDGSCYNCNKDKQEYMTEIVLNPNETIEGDCKSTKNLKILHSMQNGSKKVLTKFDLKDLKVTKL